MKQITRFQSDGGAVYETERDALISDAKYWKDRCELKERQLEALRGSKEFKPSRDFSEPMPSSGHWIRRGGGHD